MLPKFERGGKSAALSVESLKIVEERPPRRGKDSESKKAKYVRVGVAVVDSMVQTLVMRSPDGTPVTPYATRPHMYDGRQSYTAWFETSKVGEDLNALVMEVTVPALKEIDLGAVNKIRGKTIEARAHHTETAQVYRTRRVVLPRVTRDGRCQGCRHLPGAVSPSPREEDHQPVPRERTHQQAKGSTDIRVLVHGPR